MDNVELHLQPDSPFRLPDWRWQLSGYVVRRRIVPDPDIAKDHSFRLCCRLREARDSGTKAEPDYRRRLTASSIRPLRIAMGFYEDESLAKTELEARLLAKEKYEDIAKKLGTTERIVDLYEKCFFNVSDRLDAPSYITHRVIGKEVHTGMTSRSFHAIWRLYGYWAGPVVVDALAHAYSQSVRPTTADGVESLFKSDFDRMLTSKAAMYLRGIGYDGDALEKVSQLYLRLAAARESQGGVGAQESAFLQNVQALLGGLRLRRAQAGRIDKQSDLVIDQGAGTLRAAELDVVGALGHVPPALQHMVEELSFPDEESD